MSMTVFFGDYPAVFLLVLFRIMALLFTLPFFGIMRNSRRIAFGAAFPLAILFCTFIPPEFRAAVEGLRTTGDVFFALLGEVLLGVAVGSICGIFIAIFDAAGSLVESEMSLSIAEELDPMTGQSSGILTNLLRLLFFMFFLTSGAHLALIRLVAMSFTSIGVPWTGWVDCGLDLARLTAHVFEAGLSLAMPVMVVSLLTSIAMALMARLAEEFDVLFLSFPFRLSLGMLIFGASILLSSAFFEGVASDMLSSVAQFLRLS